MNRWAGRTGASLISWSQTEIDGHANAPEEAIFAGAYWRWQGTAVELDPAETFLPEGAFADANAHRRHSASAARRVIAAATGSAPLPELDRSFMLSDGRENWTVTLIDLPGHESPLLMFAGATPPAGRPLHVVGTDLGVKPDAPLQAAGVVCFTPGTLIETPGGKRPVEHLVAGDRVTTLDGGAEELVWIGTRHLAQQELARTPDLAPVRIRDGALAQGRPSGDLVVSPDHRLILRNRESEVLVAARDLVDGTTITREAPAEPVTYIHLMTERHHLILANGFEAETFHPASASLDAIPAPDRLRLFDVFPELEHAPTSYGAPARPILSSAEATLVTAA